MKSVKEVALLESQWMSDPCWDLEDTEGFEEYREELINFSREMKQIWEERYQERLIAKAAEIGIPGNLKLAQYVINLEARLDQMNQALENIYFRK